MKILYFHQYFSTPDGSIGTRSYEMARALIKAGHEVTMVCGTCRGGVSGLESVPGKGTRTGCIDGIQVIELDLAYSNYDGFVKRSWMFLQYAIKSIWVALQEPCDLVFATSTPLTAGIPGIVARWLRGKRFVFEVRDLWPELPKSLGVVTNPIILWIMSILEWLSYRSANACIGLSPGIVQGIKKRSRKGHPVVMIPNGCDFRLFSTIKIRPRRPAGVGASDFMAIFTGAHGIANGLDAIINAAEVLKQRCRDDIKLVFIGDGKLKPYLVQEAEKRKLDNCLFLDPVPKVILVDYMKGADIGLMTLANIPSFYYGTSPNKFFDYLSAGLPVLNNYPGWISDMIREFGCGYAIQPDNAFLFADALEDAADYSEKLKDMGECAKRLGRTNFSRKILASDFVSWLESVHSSKG